jgi:GNAT superfamily N-acetyltransferase
MLEVKEVENIEIIKPLWEVLNRHQQAHVRYFSDDYRNVSFEDYVDVIKSKSKFRLEVVFLNDKPLGYCLGSVLEDLGTIHELYLYDDLRGKGLGSYIFERMVFWLEIQKVKDIEVKVPSGYESMMLFYQKLGFKTASFRMKKSKVRNL